MDIFVKTPLGGYNVLIGYGAIENDKSYENIPHGGKTLIVTDDGVPKAYAKTVASHFSTPVIITLPQGERSKSLGNYALLQKTMCERGFTRGDKAIAVGGGVIGDLCGFAAATYMRGIAFYNFPTTFLADVDSSIGGKTAIDFCGVKNIVGTFYPPRKVVIDTRVLETLPLRQLSAGIAESIKMAATSDKALFSLLETAAEDYPASFLSHAEEIILKSLLIKKAVIETDPIEQGLRRVLNFGHTAGHAIESKYKGELLHGECVALGMLPMCAPAVRAGIEKLLSAYHLPIRAEFLKNDILQFLRHDKKANADEITAVYVDEIGSFRFQKESAEEIAARSAEILCGGTKQ